MSIPVRAYANPVGWRRVVRCGVLAMMLAAAGAEAQVTRQFNPYEDAELTRLLTSTSTSIASVALVDPTVSMVAAQAVAVNVTWHELLTIARADADMNLMAAIMTDALRDQDVRIRAAVAANNALLDKVRADIAWYEDKFPQFKNGQTPTASAERRAFEIYGELKARLAKLDRGGEIDLPTKGDKLIAAFDQMRAKVLGKGLFSRVQFIQNASGVTGALVALAGAATKADELLAGKLKLKGSGVEVDASPMQQLRILVENNSKDLVYFIRVWRRTTGGPVSDCKGAYALADASGQWTTVWPQDASMTYGKPESGNKAKEAVQLPSKTWLPVKLWDRIELRVATYGPERQRIRWLDVVGKLVRPEVNSLPRGFYWLAYESSASELENVKSRWFTAKETYQWRFNGAWSDAVSGPLKARVASTTGDARKELRLSALGQFELQNDRVFWCLPTTTETILSEPFLSAEVSGTAEVRHVSAKNPKGTSQPDSGSGEISMVIQRW